MAKVYKSDGEETFAGVRGNDQVVPIAVIRRGTVNLVRLGPKGDSGAATLDLSIHAPAKRLAARATGIMCDRVEGPRPERSWDVRHYCLISRSS